MNCAACGRAVPPGATNCPACGALMYAPAPPVPPVPPVPTAPRPPGQHAAAAPPQPPPNPWAAPGGPPPAYSPFGQPPNVGPYAPPFMPPAPRPVQPIRGLAIACTVLLAVWGLLAVATLVANALTYLTFGRALTDDVADSDLDTSLLISMLGYVFQYVMFVVVGIMFIVWLFRARDNAESMVPFPHRRSRVWLVLGWVVPVVSLWFPKQIVDDIWRASDPTSPVRDPKQRGPRPGVVLAWWIVFLIFMLGSGVPTAVMLETTYLEDVQLAAGANVLFALLGIVAAILVTVIVHRISRNQESQRPR